MDNICVFSQFNPLGCNSFRIYDGLAFNESMKLVESAKVHENKLK